MKWYVIQVKTGKEVLVKETLQAIGYNAAVPQEQRLIRSSGSWTPKLHTLFDGYVFINCEYNDKTYYTIIALPNFIRWVGVGKVQAIPLTAAEAEWIHLLSNGDKPLTPSKAVILPDGSLKVENGILEYITHRITKVDKHARKVSIELDLAGVAKTITLSIDVADAGAVDSSPTVEVTDIEK